MKKKTIVIIFIISVILIAFSVLFAIDMNRMKNNLPVVFSTWGYKYSPPLEEKVNLGKVVQITDKTVSKNISCAEALEKFYEDDNYEYYFSCIKSEYIIVEYENGYKEDVMSAFKYGSVTLEDLQRFNIDYIAEPKGTEKIEYNNVITISNNSTENLLRLYQFVENTKYDSENRKEDEIRVITYTIEGDPIIKNVKFVMNDNESYYEITKDTTHDKFGEQKIETKKYVSENPYTIRIIENNDYQEVCLAELPEINVVVPKVSICSFKKDKMLIEKNSFIATIIEEEPTYLIVEPNDGEIEKLQSKTRKILIAGGEYRDYIYGVGRKVIITYDNKIQNDTNTIIDADIDTDGYDDFEIEVIESKKIEKRKILNNADLHKLNTNYDLYYYGLEEVNVKVDNKVMTLENALKDGYLTMSGILSKANRDIRNKKNEEQYYEKDYIYKDGHLYPYEVRYEDGGSVEFHYANVVIIKFNKLDNNNSMYICKAGTTLNDLNK